MGVMDVLPFPFNSDASTGEDDRVYDAEDFAGFFTPLVSDGFLADRSTGLQVVSQYGNMTLTVRAGHGYINGRHYPQPEDVDLAPVVPPAGYSRIVA